MLRYLFLWCVFSVSLIGFAQTTEKVDPKVAAKSDRAVSKGNSHYQNKEYAKAEAQYRVAESRSATNSGASYNLGNSIYQAKQYAEAKRAYQAALKNASSYEEKHRIYHNLGNIAMQQKDYSAAVNAFKNALKNNPQDEQTRYNYALAKKMLKENPPQNDNQDNKKDQDKKDDKGDQDRQDNPNQDQKDSSNEQESDDQKKQDQPNDKSDKPQQNPQQNPQPKPGQSGMSPQQIENLLDAVNNEEKRVQDKVNAQQIKGKPVKTDKDW